MEEQELSKIKEDVERQIKICVKIGERQEAKRVSDIIEERKKMNEEHYDGETRTHRRLALEELEVELRRGR